MYIIDNFYNVADMIEVLFSSGWFDFICQLQNYCIYLGVQLLSGEKKILCPFKAHHET